MSTILFIGQLLFAFHYLLELFLVTIGGWSKRAGHDNQRMNLAREENLVLEFSQILVELFEFPEGGFVWVDDEVKHKVITSHESIITTVMASIFPHRSAAAFFITVRSDGLQLSHKLFAFLVFSRPELFVQDEVDVVRILTHVQLLTPAIFLEDTKCIANNCINV